MLPEFSEVFTRIGSREVADSKRAGYSHVDRETTAMAPKRDRDITGATTRFIRITKDPLLLKNWRQCSFGADLSQQVADAVVAVNEISILRAACGVVAKNIDGLHAQRTTDFFSQNWDTQTNEHSNLKIAGSHN